MSVSSIGSFSSAQYAHGGFRAPSFDKLDTNGDQALSLEELTLKGPKGSADGEAQKRAAALLKAMDTDSSGSVSPDEKTAFDTKMQEQRQGLAFTTQVLVGQSNSDVFAATDSNGDGAVSLAEFSNDDTAKGMSSDLLSQIFGMIDSNGDGAVSETESSDFLDAIKSAIDGDRHGHAGPKGHGGPEGPGGAGGPPPGPPPADATGSGSDSDGRFASAFAARASNAYTATASNTDLLKTLQSLFESP